MKTFDEKYAKPIDPKDVIPEYPENLIKAIRRLSDIKDATAEEIGIYIKINDTSRKKNIYNGFKFITEIVDYVANSIFDRHLNCSPLQDNEKDIIRFQYMYDINDDDLSILYDLPLKEIKRIRIQAVKNLAKRIKRRRELIIREEQEKQEIINTNRSNLLSIYTNILSHSVKQFVSDRHIILDKTVDKLASKGIKTVKDLINMTSNDIMKYITNRDEIERLAIRICSYNVDWTHFDINNVWPDFLRECNTDYLPNMIEDFKIFELDKKYEIDIEKLDYEKVDIVMTEILTYGRDTIIAHYKYNYDYDELAKLYGIYPQIIKFDHYQFLSYILPRACTYDISKIWCFNHHIYKCEALHINGYIEAHEYPTNLINDVARWDDNIPVLYTIPEQREMTDIVINCMDDPYKSVLISHYKEHKSWKDIAKERGVSTNRIYQIKDKALRLISYSSRYKKIMILSNDNIFLAEWAMKLFDDKWKK